MNAFNRETSVQSLAEMSGMSIRNFQIYFQIYTNDTPSKYKANFLIEPIIPEFKDIDYKIIDRTATPVLFLSYIGNYDDYASDIFEENSWNRLYKYALNQNLLPENVEYWGICYDDTDITDIYKCRLYACMTIKTSIESKLTDEIKCM